MIPSHLPDFSDIRRRIRIQSIHLRDDFRHHFPSFEPRSFLIGAAAALTIPQCWIAGRRAYQQFRIQRLLSRRHAEAGMCVTEKISNNSSSSSPPTLVLRKTGFAVGYSQKRKSPLWVSYFLCGAYQQQQQQSRGIFSFFFSGIGQQQQRRRRSKQRSLFSAMLQLRKKKEQQQQIQRLSSRLEFRADSTIPEEYRVSSADFAAKLKLKQLQHFERGHLVPVQTAASVGGCDDASLNKMIQDAALLSQVVLQHAAVNRGSWLRLERLTRLWATRELPRRSSFSIFSTKSTPSTWPSSSPIAVCCGPLFKDSNNSNGGGSFSSSPPPVPSAFFLAVLHCASGEAIAFEISNDRKGGDCCLADCVSSIDALEKRHQLRLFRSVRPWHYRPYPWQRKRVNLSFWRAERSDDGVSKNEEKKKKKKGHHVVKKTPQSRLLDTTSNFSPSRSS